MNWIDFVSIHLKSHNGVNLLERNMSYIKDETDKLFFSFENQPLKLNFNKTPTYADIYRHIHNEKPLNNSFCHNWYE